MQTTKEAREQEDHMRREFANMKTKISSDLVESIEFIDNLKSDILTTKEESQKATSSIYTSLLPGTDLSITPQGVPFGNFFHFSSFSRPLKFPNLSRNGLVPS